MATSSKNAKKVTPAKSAAPVSRRAVVKAPPIHNGAGAGPNGIIEEIEEVLEEMVTAVVPRTYHLNLNHSHRVTYQAGTQEMPKSHAEHPWSKAHGVEVYQK